MGKVVAIAAGVTMALAGGNVHAQQNEAPATFAAAQAPEAGAGVCFDADPDDAMACAVDACVAESGLAAEHCAPQTSCAPADWSADLFVQSSAGPHWHEYLCGLSSLEHLHEAIRTTCSGPGLIACSAERVWSPDGELYLAGN